MRNQYYYPLNRHESKLSGWPDDLNGNLTSKTDGVDTYVYSWSEDNQLLGVELNSSPVVSYEYDSGSRMLQRIEGSTSTNYHWDGWDLVREEKDDGVDVEVTNYLVPQGEVLAFQRDGDWFYLHGDGLSSTQLVTDESGAQVGRAVYGAWGETLSFNESVPGSLDVRFVGGLGVRNDAATGLIYMRHRWYDSELGRFISRDPIGFAGGLNLYRYGVNNPLTFVDFMGLDSLPIDFSTGSESAQNCIKRNLAAIQTTEIGKAIFRMLRDRNIRYRMYLNDTGVNATFNPESNPAVWISMQSKTLDTFKTEQGYVVPSVLRALFHELVHAATGSNDELGVIVPLENLFAQQYGLAQRIGYDDSVPRNAACREEKTNEFLDCF